MALRERTTPPGAIEANAQQTGHPIIILLNSPACNDKQVIKLFPPDPAFPGVRFAQVVGNPPVFSFQPLIEAMQAEGIADPRQHPSWPEQRRAYIRLPEIMKILLENGLE